MKKLLLLFILAFIIDIGYAQVHVVPVYRDYSKLTDSTLSTSRHELTIKADTSIRLLSKEVILPFGKLYFNSGARSWLKSIDNYGIYFGTSDTAFFIDSTGRTIFYNDVSITGGLLSTGNVTATDFTGTGTNITDLSADNIEIGTLDNNLLNSDVAIIGINFDTSLVSFQDQRNTFTKRNLFSDSIRATANVRFDSLQVVNRINAGSIISTGTIIAPNFSGDGGLLTGLDSEQLINEIDNARLSSTVAKIGTNLDTSKYLRTDTLITDTVKSKVNFNDATNFLYSATFSGNVTNTAFIKNGDLAEFEKVKIIRMFLDSTGLNRVDHGFTGWGFKNITSVTMIVMHDTTAGLGRMLPGGSNLATAISPGVNVWIDSLKINYSLPTTATGLLGDTLRFRITYGNYY